ncbi:AAA family ATPase [Phycisphaera mikurensis]|uniref:Polysaccharide biosynthesis protein n=1 Tax=Phycisphaera mikurensis (strain NBRC 102666 / KCTC 22515 / FYK2301M01) TaxID=1142394 RepID=I0IB54_PHYMF|nr:AAA family ATPase [Phycisphaera mikurensis]MBB6442993.1 Mrp family chromosome partitioning ATPase [Phycisphaera mikurensis]BAM02492.1 hypothetical protein PSMK_03330 [Phycisphaera mikurensis NBRC 102666]
MSADTQNTDGFETQTAEEEAKRRREQVLALFRGRLHWAVILALVLGSAAAVAGYFSKKPSYQAEGSIKILVEVATGVGNVDAPPMFKSYVKEQASLIDSYDVAERVLQSDAWKAASQQTGAEAISAGEFLSLLSASAGGSSEYTIVVTFTHPNSFMAATGLNEALRAYRELYRRDVAVRYDGQQREIRNELLGVDTELKNLRDKIQANLEVEEPTFRNRLIAQNDKLVNLDQALRAIRAEMNFGGAVAGEDPTVNEMQDARLVGVDEQIAAIERQIETLNNKGFDSGHRSVRDLEASIATLRGGRNEILQRIREGDTNMIGTEMAGMQRMAATIEREMEQTSALVTAMDAKLAATAPFRADVEKLQRIQSDLEIKERETRLKGAAENSRIVANFGVEPTQPSNAGARLQLAVLGFMGGAGMGLALIVLVGLLDSRLRHSADVKNGLYKTRMLGVLPSLPDSLTDPEQAERAAHAVNHIRTLLQINGPSDRVFSITGPAAGSGKSSLTVAMGLSFAASGNRVLLIDGDIVGAGLTRRLGAVVAKPFAEAVRESGRVSAADLDEAEAMAMHKNVSLADALVETGRLSREEAASIAGRAEDSAVGVVDVCEGLRLEDCVAPSGIPRLHVLPVGNARPEDAGLLSPKTLRKLLSAAREQYDIALIDTGPVLGSLEASMAAAEADATVLIVSRGDSRKIAERSLAHLREVGASVRGVVFNHALDDDLADSSYGSMVAQDRRGGSVQVDPAVAARFGPLGSAVASFGPAAAMTGEAGGAGEAGPAPLRGVA